MKETRCAYCGAADAETTDHIPPKGLFPKPLPTDLITVTCCTECHEGWSKDDEYFRTIILTGENLKEDKRADYQRQVTIDKLFNPPKVRFARYILSSLTMAELTSTAGIVLGDWPAIKIDHDRIEGVLVRIIRGLFFKEFQTPLPKDCPMFAQLDQFGENYKMLSEQVKFEPIRWAADRMFHYTFARAADAENASIWLGALYQRVAFFSFIGLRRKEPSDFLTSRAAGGRRSDGG